MEQLKLVGDFLLRYWDRLVLGLLLIALAVVMLLQANALRRAKQEVHDLTIKYKPPVGSVEPQDVTIFSAKPDVDDSRLWGTVGLCPAWKPKQIPTKLLSKDLGKRLRAAEGSIFDPPLYVFTPDLAQDSVLVHYTTVFHPFIPNKKIGGDAQEEAPKPKPQTIILVQANNGNCLSLSWDPERKLADGRIAAESCWVVGNDMVKQPLAIKVDYDETATATLISWEQETNPRTRGRIEVGPATGNCSLAHPTREQPITITAGVIGTPAQCNCKEVVPVASVCPKIRLLSVRQPLLRFELTRIVRNGAQSPKRDWTIQVEVYRDDTRKRKDSRWPQVGGDIEGTTYKVTDAEYKETPTPGELLPRVEASIKVLDKADPAAKEITLVAGAGSPRVGKPEFVLVVLPDPSTIKAVKPGDTYVADDRERSLRESFVVGEGDEQGVSLVPLDDGKPQPQRPCAVRQIAENERQQLLRKEAPKAPAGPAGPMGPGDPRGPPGLPMPGLPTVLPK